MRFLTGSPSSESTSQWIETKGRMLISLDKLMDIEQQADETRYEANNSIPDVAETSPETPALRTAPHETTHLRQGDEEDDLQGDK
jgi:hypothetical protein